MTDQVKVLISERNGVELADKEELNLVPQNIFISNPNFVSDDVNGALDELVSLNSAKVFGNNFLFNESLGLSTNNSTTVFATKNSIVVPTVPSGTYLLQVSFVFTTSNANREMDGQLWNGSSAIMEWVNSTSRVQAIPVSTAIALLTSYTGNQTLSFRFKVNGSGTTVTIRDSRLMFWRLS